MVVRLTNLETIFDAFQSNNIDLQRSILKLYSNGYSYKKKEGISYQEGKDIAQLFSQLNESTIMASPRMDGYLLNYIVKEGLGEEFDILRFSKESVLNIELKSGEPKKDVKVQLQRHRLLLNMLQKETRLFCYRSDTKQVFQLVDDELVPSTIDELASKIDDDFLETNPLEGLDTTDLIISPYVEPEKFVKHQYFLTQEQMGCVKSIMKSVMNAQAIIGGPGTGKTLVLFDIAKQYQKIGKIPLIIFCSKMSSNDAEILSKKLGINITPIKDAPANVESYQEYDVLLFDEAQRLRSDRFEWVKGLLNRKVILSVDHQQTLHPAEFQLNIQQYVQDSETIETHKLSNKIRNDPALSSFIQKMMNQKSNKVQPYDYQHVAAVYFNDEDQAAKFMEYMNKSKGYQSIEPTEFLERYHGYGIKRRNIYSRSLSTHDVIGKEYRDVMIPIDRYWTYIDGRLRSSYEKEQGYYPYIDTHMLFEMLTRVKRHLLLIIIGNPSIFHTIQEILTWKADTEWNKSHSK